MESSLATYTNVPDLSNSAQLAEFSPESNYIASFTIRMSQIFVMPSQSDETILSPCILIIMIQLIAYTEVEFARVDSIVVAVECLHTDISPDVPHAHRLVT